MFTNFISRSKRYLKRSYQLLRHPFKTTEYLTTLDENDVALYILPFFLFLIIGSLALVIMSTIASWVDPLFILVGYGIFLFVAPIFLFIGYWFWRLYSYIHWRILKALGSTGTYQNFRIGILHFLLTESIVSTLLVFPFLVLAFLSFSTGDMKNIAMMIILPNMLFPLFNLWMLALEIRFIKLTSQISYARTLLSFLCLFFLWVLFVMSFNLITISLFGNIHYTKY